MQVSRGFYVGRAALRFGKFLHEFLDIQINLLSDLPKLSIITLLSHRSHGILQSFPKVLAHDLLDKQCAFKPTVFSYPVEWHYYKEEWGKGSEKTLVQSHPILSDPMDWRTPASLSFSISWSLLKLTCIELMMSSNNINLSSPSPPALNLSQHQGLFQWVSSAQQVAKVLELQPQSFQWLARADLH